jgi:hypothetical protein
MIMSPELSKPARVLLFGHDAELLETRAKVLRSVGMIAEIALHVGDFTDAGSLYDGVVCCYAATEAECKEIVDITDRNRTPLLKLEPLLSPPELIRQVISLVRQRYPRTEGRDR